jgi:hypothetical protein
MSPASVILDATPPLTHVSRQRLPLGAKGQMPMTTFDERESSFENKFKHDRELQFKVNARRNKLLGLWAAGQLGIHGAEAEAYAKAVVVADFEKPGDQDVVDKLMGDFKAHNIEMSESRLRKQMSELLTAATTQIKSEL